ncbi:hypothetical protein YTPLAS18_15470 [Nitrospira sp.]|nr:hypothetical protein YTPLAS18_15470 [Nitrospira sp.]
MSTRIMEAAGVDIDRKESDMSVRSRHQPKRTGHHTHSGASTRLAFLKWSAGDVASSEPGPEPGRNVDSEGMIPDIGPIEGALLRARHSTVMS